MGAGDSTKVNYEFCLTNNNKVSPFHVSSTFRYIFSYDPYYNYVT